VANTLGLLNLTEESSNLLRVWLESNKTEPYPNSVILHGLALDCGITDPQADTVLTTLREEMGLTGSFSSPSKDHDVQMVSPTIVDNAQGPKLESKAIPSPIRHVASEDVQNKSSPRHRKLLNVYMPKKKATIAYSKIFPPKMDIDKTQPTSQHMTRIRR
jgi:hypothetical protein